MDSSLPTPTPPRSSKPSRFLWIIIAIALTGIIVIVFIVAFVINHYSNPSLENTNSSENNKDNQIPGNISMQERFDTCPTDLIGSGLLTSPILPLEKVTAIIPLGNFTIPGHILPVDHNYFDIFFDETSTVPVYSPGNLTLIQIDEFTTFDKSQSVLERVFVFRYVVCRGVIIDIASGHTLKGNVAKLAEETNGICNYSEGKHEGETSTRQCTYSVDYKTKSGELVAETGFFNGNSSSGEVWAFNYNITPDTEVNWKLWSDSDYGHAFCLFDLYNNDLKSAHESKMGRRLIGKREGSSGEKEYTFMKRTTEPVCGEINHDKQGTIQGSWFLINASQNYNNVISTSKTHITLSPDNLDPSLGRIVIGGTVTEPGGVMWFTPQPTGTINREFTDVTTDGKVYCYDGRENISIIFKGMEGKILVQLSENRILKIEHKDGLCKEREQLTNPFNYIR